MKHAPLKGWYDTIELVRATKAIQARIVENKEPLPTQMSRISIMLDQYGNFALRDIRGTDIPETLVYQLFPSLADAPVVTG